MRRLRERVSDGLYRVAWKVDPREPMKFTTSRVDVMTEADMHTIAAWVNGSIGGRVGLGRDSTGY